MDILKDDLLEAVGAVAPPLLLAAVARHVDALGAVLTTEEAGDALLSAICPERRFGPLGTKALIGCEIIDGEEMKWLTPSECAMHPGLSDWTPCTLAQAAMLPVETANQLAGACIPVPFFRSVGVITAEGLCSGQLVMTFNNGARATVVYGQRAQVEPVASSAYAITGDALCAIGDQLRRSENDAAALAVLAEQSERGVYPATVH